MRPKNLLLLILLNAFCFAAKAQNVAPFWSLTGNNNASAASKLGTTNAVPLSLYTGNVTRLFINPSGNVGIGTTNPIYKLHVDAGAGTAAVYGKTTGNFAVYGAGGKYGVYGAGQYGVAGSGSIYGLWSFGGSYGLYATSTNGAGGYVSSSNSVGLNAFSFNGPYGIYADAAKVGAYGVYAYGGRTGVYGYGTSYGTQGYSNDGYGIHGESFNGYGVFGSSPRGFGGYFTSVRNYGLVARSDSAYYAAVFFGRVYSSVQYVTSDKNLKQNIEDFPDALAVINRLEPKQYQFKTEAKYSSLRLPGGQHYGFMAQDLEKILPDLVLESKLDVPVDDKTSEPLQRLGADGRDPNSHKSNQVSIKTENFTIKAVNYQELIPIVVKAIQEQQVLIEELKSKVARLEALTGNPSVIKTAYLEQNIPNPVNGSTTIRYHMPAETKNAILSLTDSKGGMIKFVKLNNIGSGQERFDTNHLAAGTYNITLVVDGRTADTKRMVIVR
jgi:hypothetical protein